MDGPAEVTHTRISREAKTSLRCLELWCWKDWLFQGRREPHERRGIELSDLMSTAVLGASGTMSPPVEQTKKAGKGWTRMHVLSRGRGMGRRSNQTWGEKGSLTEPGCWSLRFLQFIVLERSVEDRARYIREPRSLGPRAFPFSGMSYDARQKCSIQNSQNVPPKKVWKCMPWTHEVGASESRRMRPTARMTERPSI